MCSAVAVAVAVAVDSALLLLQDALREGASLLQKATAAGKAANDCLGSMGSQEAAPQGQLLEQLVRESEELHSKLVHGLPAGQVCTGRQPLLQCFPSLQWCASWLVMGGI